MAEVVAVRVPESVGEGDDANTGLDKSPCDKKLVVPEGGAVAEMIGRSFAVPLAKRRVFLLNVERFDEFGRGEDFKRALVVLVDVVESR